MTKRVVLTIALVVGVAGIVLLALGLGTAVSAAGVALTGIAGVLLAFAGVLRGRREPEDRRPGSATTRGPSAIVSANRSGAPARNRSHRRAAGRRGGAAERLPGISAEKRGWAAPREPRCSAAMASPVIETRALTKRYGTARGIEGVSISVEAGEVFGFLGPNGAGKTTMIRTLLDLLHPTSGTARVYRPRQPARQPRDPRAAGLPARGLQLRRPAVARARAARLLRRCARRPGACGCQTGRGRANGGQRGHRQGRDQ